ncbi:MAG: ImmA/IrrE family metallo-endopeptidase [Bdellovibrionota bacterium]
MKKTAENRYPHSATLFKFCKEALEIRYDGNVKVIDQDVGAILGYDPADCSHWKKGKKNIRALSTLRSIADHLNIDERLLIDIASGKIGLEEAVFEFRGYGAFALQGRNLETLKKEFFKNPGKWQPDGGVKTFEELFDINRTAVAEAAMECQKIGTVTEAPVYIPEIVQMFPNIEMMADDALTESYQIDYMQRDDSNDPNSIRAIIRFKGPDMRPYIRFVAAKELFRFLVKSKNSIVSKFFDSPEEVLEIQANIFAGILLVPAAILRKEVETIDSSLDIVLQLADTFWVSKALMNQRLRDYMEYLL